MHARLISKELESRGWEVEILTLDNVLFPLRYLPHIIEKVINLIRFPLGYFYKGYFTGRLFKWLFNHATDLRIFEDIYISWNSNVPSVTLLHAVWSDNLQAFDVTAAQKDALIAREAKTINRIEHPLVTVSEPYKKFLLEEHFCVFQLRELEVIPLGIEFPANVLDIAAVRPEKSIVYCGALEARKNVMFLLKVFERLASEDKDFSLTIIGNGPEQSELEHYSNAHSLGVRFLGRFDHKDVIAELCRHKIYVHTSTKESFSFSLLEAKLAGLTTCAFNGLQVPIGFIDVPIRSFEIKEWCQAIKNLEPGQKQFDRARYTPASMTQSTLDLVFSPKSTSIAIEAQK